MGSRGQAAAVLGGPGGGARELGGKAGGGCGGLGCGGATPVPFYRRARSARRSGVGGAAGERRGAE